MSATAPVREGDVLAGKYRVERVLGVGGMGVVVAARHVQLDDRVALKFVLPEHAQNGEVVARFLREAKNAVRIRSEHVARVIDVGQLDSGSPYMVMEYLEGQDLSAALEARGPFPASLAVEVVLQACEAISEAHALGIVHRDLKPSNLFLIWRPDGTPLVKVLDFGISKVTTQQDVQITRTAAVLGSPAYMAPEQMIRSKDVDPRADVWALGIILYELLTRRLPFDGATVPEVCAKIAAEPHAPITTLRADVPPALSAAIDRCLAKQPAARFQSVAELARAIAPFGPPDAQLSLRRIEAVLRGTASDASAAPPVHTGPVAEPAHPATGTVGTWNTPARSAATRGTLIAAALGAIVALGLFVTVVAVALRRDDDRAVHPVATTTASAIEVPSASAPPIATPSASATSSSAPSASSATAVTAPPASTKPRTKPTTTIPFEGRK